MSGPQVVALGGGHGLAASLAALRRVTTELTAVVTVADDGGSSGRLRQELGALPPGDLRMALAALAADTAAGRAWAAALQHRFAGPGPLDGHAVGNLLLTGLAETAGDPVAALDLVAGAIGAVGRVLPMSPVPLEIVADVLLQPGGGVEVQEVRGQVAVASTGGQVLAVRLHPVDPPSCEATVAAVLEADWVVLGPGSWFTSVLPHLLVPSLRDALLRTSARLLVCLNLAPQPGETDGFSPEAHLEVLHRHCPELRVEVVLADRTAVGPSGEAGLERAVAATGARLLLADVAARDGSPRHDPERLAAACAEAFAGRPAPAPLASGLPSRRAKDTAWP